jgi:hypothetical protein
MAGPVVHAGEITQRSSVCVRYNVLLVDPSDATVR